MWSGSVKDDRDGYTALESSEGGSAVHSCGSRVVVGW